MCYDVFVMNKTKLKKELTFSIRIDTDTNDKVNTYAKEHKWSRNFAINEILNQFLSCKQ